MAFKFYEIHYAEGRGAELQNVGILFYKTVKPLEKAHLIVHARQVLNNPHAFITISHIAKLSKEEYEKLSAAAG